MKTTRVTKKDLEKNPNLKECFSRTSIWRLNSGKVEYLVLGYHNYENRDKYIIKDVKGLWINIKKRFFRFLMRDRDTVATLKLYEDNIVPILKQRGIIERDIKTLSCFFQRELYAIAKSFGWKKNKKGKWINQSSLYLEYNDEIKE